VGTTPQPAVAQANCTAFLVGARLLLTNQHCITNETELLSTLVDFNYDNTGSTPSGVRLEKIAAQSRELDYALVRLSEDPPGAGRLHFAPSDEHDRDKQPLLIIQHPGGQPKHVSMKDCHISGLGLVGVDVSQRSDFGHACDTLGGSSGSPVIDWNTRLVVGLHHFGFLPGAKDPVNQAVMRTLILQDIRQQDAAAHAEMVQPRPVP
jgi:hypothetical protein